MSRETGDEMPSRETVTTATKEETGKKKRSSDQVDGNISNYDAVVGNSKGEGLSSRHTKKSGTSSGNSASSGKTAHANSGATNSATATNVYPPEDQDTGKKRGSDQVLQVYSAHRSNEESIKRKKVPKPPHAATASVAAGRILDRHSSSITVSKNVNRRSSSLSPIRTQATDSHQHDAGSGCQETFSLEATMSNKSTKGQQHENDVSPYEGVSTTTCLSSPAKDSSTPRTSRVSITKRKPVAHGLSYPNSNVWDIESALMYLVSPPPSSQRQGVEDHDRNFKDDREYLIERSLDAERNLENNVDGGLDQDISTTAWISFRVAHAGDASCLASWYQRQKQEVRSKDEVLSTQRKESHDEKPDESATAAPDRIEDPDTTAHQDLPPPFDRRGSDASSESNNNPKKNVDIHRTTFETELRVHERRRSSSTASSNGDGSQKSSPSNVTRVNSGSGSINHNVDTTVSNGGSGSISTMLEHWIAEGLGNEDNCPSLYGLLAYIHREQQSTANDDGKTKTNDDDDSRPDVADMSARPHDHPVVLQTLCAAVLLTVTWQDGQRCLRVEWIAIGGNNDDDKDENDDKDDHHPAPKLEPMIALIIQQKLWLRITALSLMIDCPFICMDDYVRSIMTNVVHQAGGRRRRGMNEAGEAADDDDDDAPGSDAELNRQKSEDCPSSDEDDIVDKPGIRGRHDFIIDTEREDASSILQESSSVE